jgi:hypothetical protein
LAVLIGVASVLAAFAFILLRHNCDGWLLPACGNPVRSRSRAPPGHAATSQRSACCGADRTEVRSAAHITQRRKPCSSVPLSGSPLA